MYIKKLPEKFLENFGIYINPSDDSIVGPTPPNTWGFLFPHILTPYSKMSFNVEKKFLEKF